MTDSRSIEEHMRDVIDSTPIIDNHAHPLLKPSAISKHPFLAIATEAHGDALDDSRSTLAHFRAVKQLAAILGCECSWEAVEAAIERRRERSYEEWIRRCLQGIQCVLVDDGLDNRSDAEAFEYFDSFTASPARRIVRIEAVVEEIIRGMMRERFDAVDGLKEVTRMFTEAIREALDDEQVVGFKSVICYRTGLAIPPRLDHEKALRAYEAIHNRYHQSNHGEYRRLDNPGLNEYFVHLLARIMYEWPNPEKKPIQFHTGLGDNDITLTTSSPSHLQEFIRAYPNTPIVLLHASYPFTREAGYLAAMYANVYADIGEVFPFLSRDGQAAVVRQAMELCPATKILWSTDGHWFPETYLLAVEQAKEVIGTVLCEYVRKGDLTLQQASRWVEDVMFHNSNRIYHLHLEPKKMSFAPLRSPLQGGGEMNGLQALHNVNGAGEAQFLRVCWSDLSGLLRMRAIPMRRVRSMLSNSGSRKFEVGITQASLAITQTDLPVRGFSPTGEWKLVPDWRTLRRGPRDGHLMAMGGFWDGNQPAQLCPRNILQRVLDSAKDDLIFTLGFEIELVLLPVINDGPVMPPQSSGHAWSTSRAMELSGAVSVVEKAVTDLEAAGVYVELVHAESANGQYEVVLPRAPAMEAIDTLLFAREVISSTATSAGYRMTLHPKPYAGSCGTASHVHMSMAKPDGSPVATQTYESFYAGVLHHLCSICAFTCSSRASYERLQPGCWAGSTWVAWGEQNREVPLRKVCDSHWELKCVDGMANMYLAMAAVLGAGIDGALKKRRELKMGNCVQDPDSLTDDERRELGIGDRLPRSIGEALDSLESDGEDVKGWMTEDLVTRYKAVKEAEEEFLENLFASVPDCGEGIVRRWIMARY